MICQQGGKYEGGGYCYLALGLIIKMLLKDGSGEGGMGGIGGVGRERGRERARERERGRGGDFFAYILYICIHSIFLEG